MIDALTESTAFLAVSACFLGSYGFEVPVLAGDAEERAPIPPRSS